MSTLSKLTFVEPTRARSNSEESPVTKFIAAVDNQIAAAASFENGETFTVDAIRYVGEGAERVKEHYQRPLRHWFGEATDGTWFVAVRYGNRPLRISEDGKHAVLCKSYDDVVPTLKLLKKAAEAGELDDAINEAKKAGGRKK